MSLLMKSFVDGQALKYTRDITCFLAPYINSCRSGISGRHFMRRAGRSWSQVNRTAGVPSCAETPERSAIRIECRLA